eukprot:CAMPEP_0175888720 /NCGR_PEP_ID=MMETSP0107_2-20121207/46884_1 /TAXON_ID=195067 ORGANISM="Goniomonas pacifica, Strain CCMP1869" /NCGR_SAMPLE_ID=MMETSP0107_2 /ASSEMBLY_ACC=CAM_ASM_000203 /LENGTH=100 /DNA_ID=CAMNT_0017209315 /DNA_START=845 /DNA_END=1147 /DNA_ORIENTATION=+
MLLEISQQVIQNEQYFTDMSTITPNRIDGVHSSAIRASWDAARFLDCTRMKKHHPRSPKGVCGLYQRYAVERLGLSFKVRILQQLGGLMEHVILCQRSSK